MIVKIALNTMVYVLVFSPQANKSLMNSECELCGNATSSNQLCLCGDVEYAQFWTFTSVCEFVAFVLMVDFDVFVLFLGAFHNVDYATLEGYRRALVDATYSHYNVPRGHDAVSFVRELQPYAIKLVRLKLLKDMARRGIIVPSVRQGSGADTRGKSIGYGCL